MQRTPNTALHAMTFDLRHVSLLLLASVLALGACGTYVNTQNPNANYDQDKLSCEVEALRNYPQTIAYQTEQFEAVCKRRDAQGRCLEMSPPGQRTTPIDINEKNRNNFVQSCLRIKGWRYETR